MVKEEHQWGHGFEGKDPELSFKHVEFEDPVRHLMEKWHYLLDV